MTRQAICTNLTTWETVRGFRAFVFGGQRVSTSVPMSITTVSGGHSKGLFLTAGQMVVAALPGSGTATSLLSSNSVICEKINWVHVYEHLWQIELTSLG